MKLNNLFRYMLLTVFSIAAVAEDSVTTFDLTIAGEEPLYQTTLIKEVYQHSRSKKLSDLSIINAEGEQVPYALLPYDYLHALSITNHETKKLLFYPVKESSLKNSDELRIHLEKNAAKTMIDLTSTEAKTKAQTLFIIDAGKKHPLLQTLSLTWQGSDGQLIPLEVLGSDDLKNWAPLGDGVLLKTSQGGSQILQNRINLTHSTDARYLQVRLSETGIDAFTLTGVTAGYDKIKPLASEIIWQDLQLLNREQEKNTGQININYESLGYFPVSKLTVHLPQENTITSATIQVRNKTNEPWAYLTSASLYYIKQQGKTLVNPTLEISPSAYRYWQLQFNQANGGIGKENPALSVGWEPQTLIWNARGKAPFKVQVGNNPDIINNVEINKLIPDLTLEKVQKLPQAQIAYKSVEDKPTGDTSSAWISAPDYKRWLLWGGLVLGVLLLAGMAYSLLKTEHKK